MPSAVKRFGDSPEDAAVARYKAEGGAGANAAHRTTTLALCWDVSDAQLPDAARADAKLTHAHPFSVEAAAGCAVVLRLLVRGVPWHEALDAARLEVRPCSACDWS